jgi:hypothetical protein
LSWIAVVGSRLGQVLNDSVKRKRSAAIRDGDNIGLDCEFGDYALTFEVVYYVLSPDFAIYMDTQQGINLGIHRRFEAAGVSFAYPTQELILRRGPALMTVAGAAP